MKQFVSCEECGKMLPGNAKVCSECGKEREHVTSRAEVSRENPKPDELCGIFVMLVVAILVMFVFAYFFRLIKS
jgi:uncharacterized membrane protein YvbJ